MSEKKKTDSEDWKLVEDINEHLISHVTRKPEDREGLTQEDYKEILRHNRAQMLRFIKLNQREKKIQYGSTANQDAPLAEFLNAVKSGEYEIPETGESLVLKQMEDGKLAEEIPEEVLQTPALVGRVLRAIAQGDTNALERIKKAMERRQDRLKQGVFNNPAMQAVHAEIKQMGVPPTFDDFCQLLDDLNIEIGDGTEARKWYKDVGGKMPRGRKPKAKKAAKRQPSMKDLKADVDRSFSVLKKRDPLKYGAKKSGKNKK